jgi:ribonuclease R
VIATAAPDASGQWLEVEDADGVSWKIECLGEPVSVGAQVAFVPLEKGAGDHRGELTRVLDEARATWVVRIARSPQGGIFGLIPFAGVECPDFLLKERDAKGAEVGDRVVVAPLDEGRVGKKSDRGGRRPRGSSGGTRPGMPVKVVTVLGQVGQPDADHQALVWKHRLTSRFSRRTTLEAEGLDDAVSPVEMGRRVDLRHLPFITIDPASAKDHDDAVFAEDRASALALKAVDGGLADLNPGEGKDDERPWTRRLWVAIADVCHFVEPGGFIDSEARRRGNSFYFPDRSIPMLPERLSSDLCSLRPDVDRRALVAELRVGSDGRVVNALFHEAMIRSHARLAYEDAAVWLKDEEGKLADQPWGASLRCLDRIAEGFGEERAAAGALTLELPEVQIVVDDEGRAIDAQLRSRNRAHILIEEAMLAANRAVARALDLAERPTIHRSHPPPSPQKLDDLAMLLERHGIDAAGDLSEPGVLAAALVAAKGMPSEERIHMAALRSMSQARYQLDSAGHYALRFDHYLHFTSPIRRYADLEVHRALRKLIRDEPAAETRDARMIERAESVSIWLSGRERVAQEAERDAAALASCAMMGGHEDENFEAEVTGATEFGLFIRLEAPSVSGLLPIRLLDGRWELVEEEEALISQGGRQRIGVGDILRVRLIEVDSDRARLTFRLAGRQSREGNTRR